VKLLLANGIIAFGVVFSIGCRSTPATTGEQIRRLTLEEFVLLDWQRQVEYLDQVAVWGTSGDDDRIIANALSNAASAVIVKALEVSYTLELKQCLPRAEELMQSNDPIIRWRALLLIEKLNSDEVVLPQVARLTGDKEWLVREAAYRTLRTFSSERKKRTYFYTVLFRLNEKNPSVVAEIYRTLVWYNDESAWPYMIKRSYHCKSVSELILVMRELARTKTREAQVRLKTLTRSQSVIVRQEANDLLKEYF
jgi:HEAT repeat protein